MESTHACRTAGSLSVNGVFQCIEFTTPGIANPVFREHSRFRRRESSFGESSSTPSKPRSRTSWNLSRIDSPSSSIIVHFRLTFAKGRGTRALPDVECAGEDVRSIMRFSGACGLDFFAGNMAANPRPINALFSR
jgi:hypothetical protein